MKTTRIGCYAYPCGLCGRAGTRTQDLTDVNRLTPTRTLIHTVCGFGLSVLPGMEDVRADSNDMSRPGEGRLFVWVRLFVFGGRLHLLQRRHELLEHL